MSLVTAKLAIYENDARPRSVQAQARCPKRQFDHDGPAATLIVISSFKRPAGSSAAAPRERFDRFVGSL